MVRDRLLKTDRSGDGLSDLTGGGRRPPCKGVESPGGRHRPTCWGVVVVVMIVTGLRGG